MTHLPFSVARILGRWLGCLLYLFPTRNYAITLKNLEICYPDMPEANRVAMAKQSLQETGKTALEALVLWRLQAKALNLTRNCRNLELFTGAIADERGLILLVPHQCNWEYLNHFLTVYTPMLQLYQPAENPVLDEFVRAGRNNPHATLVPTNKRGVLQIIKALRAGGTTGILPDQIPEETASGEFAPFFGKPAFTMTLVHSLLQRSNCQVIVCSVRRMGSGFEVIFGEPDDAIYSGDVVTSLTAMNKAVEDCIANAPEEYSWEYKRFRVRSANTKAVEQTIQGVKY